MHLFGLDLPVSAPVMGVAIVVSCLAAAVQGVVGFGYAIIAVPLLSLLDPRFAPVPQILTALPLTVMTAWRERGHIDGKGVAWILVGRVPGFLIGALLVAIASRRQLDLVIGISVMVGVACLGARGGISRSRFVDMSAGTLSGISGYVSGIGGPPLALLYRDALGPTIRSTLGLLFAVGIVATVVTRAIFGQITALDVKLGAVLLVPVVFGTWASGFLHGLVGSRSLRAAVLILCAAAAIGLLLRATGL
jgi:uncharacterized membrane protein YfcA